MLGMWEADHGPVPSDTGPSRILSGMLPDAEDPRFRLSAFVLLAIQGRAEVCPGSLCEFMTVSEPR